MSPRRPADPRRRRSRRRNAAGLSLIELTLALAGTALVGTAVAAMLQAAAYGSSSGTELRDLIPAHRVPAARIRDLLNTSQQVYALSATEVVLWYDDLNDDGVAQSKELAWLRYNAGAQKLVLEKPNPLFPVNVAVTAATNFAFTRWGFNFAGNMQVQDWAENVTACSFIGDVAAPDTGFITWRITLSVGGKSEAQVHAANVGIHE